ncbi:hypothetical protein [Leptolyngbya sp. KIOST-1]|uniref:hypothetical protein n=1 Tax=Leptolyngbya sp. KIOST-1 TaxID=1229172 RepID=UPI00055F92B3|nr:hypothetical protein [Leptolyngbya sp. KIOST-1]
MDTGRVVYVSVFPGWVAGVTYHRGEGYRCWVINPEMTVLSDGEMHASSDEAIAAGRLFIHHSTGAEPDRGGKG